MRIRLISIMVSVILVLSLTSAAMADDGYYVQTAEITATINNPNPADRLNLRTAPRTDAPTLGKYYTGTFVEVLGEEKNGWVKVRFCNLEGYMQKAFLAFDEDRGLVGSAIPGVKVNNLNGTGMPLREEQSVDSASLGLYKNGEMILVYGVGETWCHVQAGGKIGFMLREQLFPVLAFNSSGGGGIVAESGVRAAVVNNPNPADRLNLRTAPRMDAPTLGKYYNGTFVEVLSDEKDGWMKVRFFDLEGYMMAKFLVSPEQLEIGAATVPAAKIANAGGAGLHLRKAQSIRSASLGLYKNGSTVRVFGVNEIWCHVQVEDGNVGFMLRDRLSPAFEFDSGSGDGTPPGGYIDPIEGTWQGEPGDEITEDFMPGGNG